jgi:tetratricopeptide (TPR) repeat protein
MLRSTSVTTGRPSPALGASPREAEEAHRQALSLAPNHPVLLRLLSECYEQSGELEQAFAVMSALLQVHPTAHIYRLRIDYLLGRLRESDRAAVASLLPFNDYTLDAPASRAKSLRDHLRSWGVANGLLYFYFFLSLEARRVFTCMPSPSPKNYATADASSLPAELAVTTIPLLHLM